MRVMVVNQSEPLRQVLQYVFENGIDVDVVADIDELETLPQQVAQLQPDWLFLLQDEYTRFTGVVDYLLSLQPDLHVILLSADGKHVRFQKDRAWQTEVDTWAEYTLSDFIYFLTTETLPPASVQSIEEVGEEKERP